MNRVDLISKPPLASTSALSCRTSHNSRSNANNEKLIVLSEQIVIENMLKLANYVAMIVSEQIKSGKTVAIDCGIKGLMLRRYAVTRFDERLAADHLLNGSILDKARTMSSPRVRAREEIRWVKSFFGIPRRHLFVIFETKDQNNS